MNLEEAIERVKDLMEDCKAPPVYYRIELSDDGSEGIALEVVLKELHTLQMNYKLLEEKFDGSAEEKVDKLTEELITTTRTIKIKDEYLQLIDFLLVDYDGCNTVESLKELIDETRDYIHKALKNDDKTVIYEGMKNKFNILHEEVE